ncbi:pyridoxal-phosphate dependent enzyme [Schlesneria paludicola]|uniref:pyridoxal-phosphate dependent enzyme n=1 Tax=Schlesneria paludicola TaxID=360056 RepID=UPI00029A13DF|nr:pyridoxal-phosphate dependent enzyme [Schlesneria paludicola]
MNQGLWRFAKWIDPIPESARVSLGEGGTPLVRSRRIGPSVGLKNLYFKLEFTNPTGSYKDRFACAAISDMVANGKTECIATSSGNTGAALAAYCAVAGITCEIAIVEKAPEGKLRQMLAYGAKLYRVRGFGVDSRTSDRVIECLKLLSGRPQAQMQISAFAYSPIGMSGVYSISHELVEQITDPIDHVFCMAGGGGFVLAIARGFEQLLSTGQISRRPKVECVQPAGNNTIAGPLKSGLNVCQTVECTTRISGLQVPQIIDGNEVIAACRLGGGTGHVVSDESIFEAQSRLALEEGLFSEPAGSTAVAGVLQAARQGLIDPHANIVCVISGSGFKDPSSLEAMTRHASCPTIELAELEQRVADHK